MANIQPLDLNRAGGAISSTIPEFARRHQVSIPTVYGEINGGRLSTYKIGKKARRISAKAEADWLAAREAESSVGGR